jgi:hypothetical protein
MQPELIKRVDGLILLSESHDWDRKYYNQICGNKNDKILM